jgi:hypothetical protein
MTLTHKCGLSRLTFVKAVPDCVVSEAEPTTPIHQRIDFTHVRHEPSVSSIVGLLLWCRPSAILRIVVTIVVSSIQHVQIGWPITHVGSEVPEINPPVAHDNSSTSVVSIFRVVRIPATGQHGLPNPIFLAPPSSMDRVVFDPNTSTRQALCTDKAIGVDRLSGSAVARAKPFSFPVFNPEIAYHHPSTESLSGYIPEVVDFGGRNDYEFGSVIHSYVCLSLETGSGTNRDRSCSFTQNSSV